MSESVDHWEMCRRDAGRLINQADELLKFGGTGCKAPHTVGAIVAFLTAAESLLAAAQMLVSEVRIAYAESETEEEGPGDEDQKQP